MSIATGEWIIHVSKKDTIDSVPRCARACGNRNPCWLNRKRVTSQLSVSLDCNSFCAYACVRMFACARVRLRACV